MRVLGIITEYNPFHNGHKYHLQKSIEASSADHVVCVMSGNYIQRGEPALVNKWARAEMALKNGVDLVIELPTVYAMASAEFFAWGAVKILDALGVVDDLCFGSESGQLKELEAVARLLIDEPEDYRRLLKQHLDKGHSYPAAREWAVKSYLKMKNKTPLDLEDIMSSSNNILGIEYLKALGKLHSKIRPITVSRQGSAYNATELEGCISSATSIRKQIDRNHKKLDTQVLSQVLPPESLNILQREFEGGRGPIFPSHFEGMILSQLRRLSIDQLRLLPYVSEGLENRIKEAGASCGTLESVVDRIATRRYPRTRIQRSLFHLVTGLQKEEFDQFNHWGGPQYIKILGFNCKGRFLLSHIHKHATLPVITKAAHFKNSCNPLLKRMLEFETAATDQYVLTYRNPAHRTAGQEYTQNIVRIGD